MSLKDRNIITRVIICFKSRHNKPVGRNLMFASSITSVNHSLDQLLENVVSSLFLTPLSSFPILSTLLYLPSVGNESLYVLIFLSVFILYKWANTHIFPYIPFFIFCVNIKTLLTNNSHTIKFTHLKGTCHCFFSIFTVMWSLPQF